MKQKVLAVAVLVLAVLMVAPIMRSVNLPAGKPATIHQTQYADGWPMPPLPPPKPPAMESVVLVADSFVAA